MALLYVPVTYSLPPQLHRGVPTGYRFLQIRHIACTSMGLTLSIISLPSMAAATPDPNTTSYSSTLALWQTKYPEAVPAALPPLWLPWRGAP